MVDGLESLPAHYEVGARAEQCGFERGARGFFAQSAYGRFYREKISQKTLEYRIGPRSRLRRAGGAETPVKNAVRFRTGLQVVRNRRAYGRFFGEVEIFSVFHCSGNFCRSDGGVFRPVLAIPEKMPESRKRSKIKLTNAASSPF